jgi:hypothetical protein
MLVNEARRSNVRHNYFSAVLDCPESLQGRKRNFTIKFRTDASQPWHWVNEDFNLADGELYFQAKDLLPSPGPPHSSSDLSQYVEDLSKDINVEPSSSDCPGTQLFNLTGKASPADSKASSFTHVRLGRAAQATRWFALVRIWSCWLAPRHGKKKFRLTEPGVMCSFLREDGLSMVLLALSGIRDILTIFESDKNGYIVINARNDRQDAGTYHVIAAIGADFHSANAAAMYQARRIVASTSTSTSASDTSLPQTEPLSSPLNDDTVLVEDEAKAQWLENWYDGLAYCTWNGLGQALTEQKIFSALDALEASGITITNLIIDDNWQSLDNASESQFKRGMTRFEANSEGFPNGLRHTASVIRHNHPTIQHIAVWHAMLGYWGGISPTGDLAKNYATCSVKMRECEIPVERSSYTVIDAPDIPRFFNDFYDFLSSSGIDAVKTDVQSFLDVFDSPSDRSRLLSSYLDAWTIASLRHFSTKAISCMSQAPQILFHTQLPQNKPKFLVRNSDDFFPDISDSHPWHIFCNAHNSLLTQHLNVLPDWDMFQTSHLYSHFHGAARCVSGGPIYITDEPGKHSIDLINQMTARTVRGNTVILRPSVVGKSLEAYNSYIEELPLRVGTYHGAAKTGTGIIGVFNIAPKPISTLLPLSVFPGIDDADPDTQYIIRAHTTSEVSDIMTPDSPAALASIELESKGYEILTMYPLRSFTSPSMSSTTFVAPLGLLGKMTGAAAIASSDMYIETTGRLRISASLRALGTLGIFISDLGSRNEEDLMVVILARPVPRATVKKADGDERVLEVDVERAWKEMELRHGWSNEVEVEIFVKV